jgi:outer membrane biosynthesis protein TonB
MPLAPDTNASPPEDTPAPAPVIPAATTTPRPVAIPQTKPAPTPHKPATAQPEQTSEQPAHPPAPQISLQISPGDQASYERKTNEDISVARKDLQQASGKQLNAAQQDLVEKIASFLSQSFEASKDGDWARAQNLAQKARLLSDELVNSL